MFLHRAPTGCLVFLSFICLLHTNCWIPEIYIISVSKRILPLGFPFVSFLGGGGSISILSDPGLVRHNIAPAITDRWFTYHLLDGFIFWNSQVCVSKKKSCTNLLDTQNKLAPPYCSCVHNVFGIPKTLLPILCILNYNEGTHSANTLKEET